MRAASAIRAWQCEKRCHPERSIGPSWIAPIVLAPWAVILLVLAYVL